MENYSSSLGEEIIEEFLDEKGIYYKREVKIKLKGDYADYRVVDFYLPRYKVYIEFFGRWNVEKNRIKYRKKKEIYDKNNLPCIYLYPDNLGIIEYTFQRRIREVLKSHPELKFQRFEYNFHLLMEKHLIILVITGFLIYFIKDMKGKIVFLILFIFSFYNALKNTFFK